MNSRQRINKSSSRQSNHGSRSSSQSKPCSRENSANGRNEKRSSESTDKYKPPFKRGSDQNIYEGKSEKTTERSSRSNWRTRAQSEAVSSSSDRYSARRSDRKGNDTGKENQFGHSARRDGSFDRGRGRTGRGSRGGRGGRGQNMYFKIDGHPKGNDLRKLEQLNNQSPSEILLALVDPDNGLNEFLQQPSLPNEVVTLLLKLIVKGFTSQMHIESLHQLMGMLLGSNLFIQHIPIFVSSFMTLREDLNAIYANLIQIFGTFLSRMPAIASEVLNSSVMLCANMMETLNRRNLKINDDLKQDLQNVQKQIEEILESTKELRLKQKMHDCSNRDEPPNNFRDLPIIPTTIEIVTGDKPFLRKNIVEGRYYDVEHYLDVQFRLLREDFISPLRQGICEYLQDNSGRKKQWRYQDVRLYERVQVDKVLCKNGGIFYQLKFDTNPLLRVKWETSRRLMFGSLLCLSSDHFQTCRFATIVNRDVNKLKQGILEVKLEDENEGNVFLSKVETRSLFTMAESPAYFEAYRHILSSLKQINEDNMPFQDFIVYMKNKNVPPKYLDSKPVCNLSFMFNNLDTHNDLICSNTMVEMVELARLKRFERLRSAGQIITTDLTTWPSAETLGLDDSQRRAMQLALSSSVAVIQGPPGTGKTFVGLKIVQALLENHYRDITPILVVCLTNHALDQFLVGILSTTTNLIRVGGRSENSALEPYNLRNFISKEKRYRLSDLSAQRTNLEIKLKECQHELNTCKEDLKSVHSFILHEEALQNIPEPDLTVVLNFAYSFEQTFCYDFTSDGWRPASYLLSWLGLCTDELVNDYDMQEFHIQEITHPKKPSLPAEPEIKIDAEPTEDKLVEDKPDAVDSDDDVVDIEDEAAAESKNRMLDTDNIFAEDYEIEGIAKKRSSFWAMNIDLLNDPYKMHGLGGYSNVPLEECHEDNPNYDSLCLIKKNFSSLQQHFRMIRAIVDRELSLTDIMENDEITPDLNVWSLSLQNRWRLYRRWLKLFQEQRKRKIEELQREYKILGKQLKNVINQQEYRILKDCSVIGMTTNGAARYQPILYEIGCKIVIIEEAAEVLETHIISTLNPQTEHLILIGDHLQLRPKPTVYYLAKKFNLDISLFERLIKNGLPYETLELQHRMRPEISRLIISHIYPQLRDHPSVQNYPSVFGMENNLFFVTHTEKEQEVADTKSHANRFEAEYIVGLCRYLLQQGYERNRITILTMYVGQLFALRKLMPKNTYEGVRVVAVDNYQGEENDIILLSLVRSNEEGKVGFVKTENRINVALSRARHGLYVIGNFQFLADNSDLWRRLMADLQMNYLTGPSLKIICRNHPENHSFVSKGIEFQKFAPEGGCLKKCDAELPCGHICQRVCHIDDHGKCLQPCAGRCPSGHSCPLLCYEGCKPCKKLVLKDLPCGHVANMYCSMEPLEYKCLEIVDRILPHCEHRRSVQCYKDINKVKCKENCCYRLNCGHKCELKCHPLEDPEHTDTKCLKACERKICKQHEQNCVNRCWESCSYCQIIVHKTLECGHECKAQCGLENVLCKRHCERLLPCGHQCKGKCSEDCQTECKQLVDKMLTCGHTIKVECSLRDENIDNIMRRHLFIRRSKLPDYRCKKPCEKKLACGHSCKNLCHQSCTAHCMEIVTKTGICQHQIKLKCCYSSLNPELISQWCREPCSQLLFCEHDCQGTCGECFQGRVHMPCKNRCGRVQICEHACDIPCSQECPPCNKKCPNRCTHSKCPNKCGFPCKKCKEYCKWRCSHYRCNSRCSDEFHAPPCNEPCSKKLRCKHPCIGLCGEDCPTICRVCHPEKLTEVILSGLEDEPDSRFIQLHDCGHCFEVSALDQWMNMESDKIQMKSCPKCKTVIWISHRYGSIIRECLKNIQSVKKRASGKMKNNRITMKRLLNEIEANFQLKEIFPQHCTTLIKRLSQKYTLNHVECVVIENQILLLKAMAKVKTRDFYKIQSKNYLQSSIEFLSERLMLNDQRMSEHELNSIEKELRRLSLYSSLIELKEIYDNKSSTLATTAMRKEKLRTISSVFEQGRVLTKDEEQRFIMTLDEMMDAEGLGISHDEKVMIVKAMDLKKGAWYKCPNGHIYAIGDCGGATEQGKCYECQAAIGGSGHRLLNTNAHAGEMDGSSVPAWPISDDMRNYNFI